MNDLARELLDVLRRLGSEFQVTTQGLGRLRSDVADLFHGRPLMRPQPVEFLEPEYADPNDPMPEVTADDQFIADDGSLHDTFEAWFDRQEDLGVWDDA